jgi:hypothetical protein
MQSTHNPRRMSAKHDDITSVATQQSDVTA